MNKLEISIRLVVNRTDLDLWAFLPKPQLSGYKTIPVRPQDEQYRSQLEKTKIDFMKTNHVSTGTIISNLRRGFRHWNVLILQSELRKLSFVIYNLFDEDRMQYLSLQTATNATFKIQLLQRDFLHLGAITYLCFHIQCHLMDFVKHKLTCSIVQINIESTIFKLSVIYFT